MEFQMRGELCKLIYQSNVRKIVYFVIVHVCYVETIII